MANMANHGCLNSCLLTNLVEEDLGQFLVTEGKLSCRMQAELSEKRKLTSSSLVDGMLELWIVSW